MAKRFSILFFSVLAIVCILFYLGYKSQYAKNVSTETVSSEFEYPKFYEKSLKSLPDSVKLQLVAAGKIAVDSLRLTQLSHIWESSGNLLVSANYDMEYAEKFPGKNSWLQAGKKYYNAAAYSSDSLLQREAAVNAKSAFEKVLKSDPENLEAKNALGILYVQVENNIMKGVLMLKEILTKDSNNSQAIYSLGMLSIQSGQLDKAEQRFYKLTLLQPFNPDYYYYLADVYAREGKTEKAIQTYETCKTLVKEERSKKDIDNIIQKLKKL
ncbi:MAG: tetratricopeptide repeat protein [Bacteroidia bacterium]